MKPYHHTPVFWAGTVSGLFTAFAAFWTLMPADWRPEVPEMAKWIFCVAGFLPSAAVMLLKRWEAPRPAKPTTDDTDEAGA